MLGDEILVAPILAAGAKERTVILPRGAWKGFDGKLYEGPANETVPVPYDQLCYFEKAN
jgi:alpha-glucosidase (family GH31 glycosyl hydrolase)